METHFISPDHISIADIHSILSGGKKLALSEICKKKISGCRNFLDEHLSQESDPVYGINTGFGALCNHTISNTDLEKLQVNLVISHACGVGEMVPEEIVRIMLLLKIQSLSYGHSGVQLVTVQRLIDLYNQDILPVVYTQGSLGASGDLAPLAHLSLPLLGLGQVLFQGKIQNAGLVLKKLNFEPIHLKSKEGLALLNGTQFMSAYGVWCIIKSEHLSETADQIAALSIDAFDGRPDPFNELLHQIRPHAGQKLVAKNILKYLEGSEILGQKKSHVQDPYSFRCIPQVHGATRDTLEFVKKTITIEINSVTDNPTIFPEKKMVLSGGNFHGQPLALALDYLAIALAELGNISERRTYLLVSGQRNLPAFLVSSPGLNSGFMIPQYTAASIVSQNKQLCTPSSVDSIVSSNGQEDHVSMGANAAFKCSLVVNNLFKILAIELFTAAQALEYRRPLKSSNKIEGLIKNYRQYVPNIAVDELMYPHIQNSISFLENKIQVL